MSNTQEPEGPYGRAFWDGLSHWGGNFFVWAAWALGFTLVTTTLSASFARVVVASGVSHASGVYLSGLAGFLYYGLITHGFVFLTLTAAVRTVRKLPAGFRPTLRQLFAAACVQAYGGYAINWFLIILAILVQPLYAALLPVGMLAIDQGYTIGRAGRLWWKLIDGRLFRELFFLLLAMLGAALVTMFVGLPITAVNATYRVLETQPGPLPAQALSIAEGMLRWVFLSCFCSILATRVVALLQTHAPSEDGT